MSPILRHGCQLGGLAIIPIAFGHRKRVGKDTAGRFLCSFLRVNRKGSNIQFAGFADKLKDICRQLYGWAGLQSGPYYEDNSAEREIILPKLGKTPRQIWIDVANKVGRDIYPDTWSDYLFNDIKCDICIIKDLRFPNEAEKIHEYGGYIYRIDRDCVPKDTDGADDPLADYAGWDGIIQNNGSIAELNQEIIRLGEKLLLQLPKKDNQPVAPTGR